MKSEMLSDLVSVTLAKALDGAATRHRVLAKNIANVDTPGYKRREVNFHDQLKSTLDSVRDNREKMAGIERVQPQTFVDRTRSARADGNTVSIEQEMGELAKNSLDYESNVQLLKSKLRLLRLAISGR